MMHPRTCLAFLVIAGCHAGSLPGPVPDEGVAADTAGDEGTPVADAVQDPTPEGQGPAILADVLGTWYDCIGSITFHEDGTFRYTGLDGQCETRGTYSFRDYVLNLHVAHTSCPTDPTNRMADFYKKDIVALPTPAKMIWSHPELDTGRKLWMRSGFYFGQKWVFHSTDATRAQDFRMCFTEGGVFETGFYFKVPGLAGLLSDSGRVDRLIHTPGKPDELQVRTTCQGECLCAGILVVERHEVQMTGRAFHANCTGLDPAAIEVTGQILPWDGYLSSRAPGPVTWAGPRATRPKFARPRTGQARSRRAVR